MSLNVLEPDALTEEQFNDVSGLVKSICGINLHDGKKELVKARLAKRVRELRLGSFDDYLAFVRGDASGNELTIMLDRLSTNLTYFFREPAHLDVMKSDLLPRLLVKKRSEAQLRIWSAGCSSGEEPYSIAITLLENFPELRCWDVKVLATDLSTRVLARAREGLYEHARFRQTPGHILSKYFECVRTRPDRLYRVQESVRGLVHFGRLNLMDSWPMRGPFDLIFCRNVMIYFDKPTQGRLVGRFWNMLAPDGVLFVGHSESLTGINHHFRYLCPAAYQKVA